MQNRSKKKSTLPNYLNQNIIQEIMNKRFTVLISDQKHVFRRDVRRHMCWYVCDISTVNNEVPSSKVVQQDWQGGTTRTMRAPGRERW